MRCHLRSCQISTSTYARATYLKVVSQNFMDLIDEDCLEFVQLSALLGSYWLYWGRPRSSFSILGAATKSAQAMELHRNTDNRSSAEDAEERKRVWWTIYTWDRCEMSNSPEKVADVHTGLRQSYTAVHLESMTKTATSRCRRLLQRTSASQLKLVLLESLYRHTRYN